MKYCEDCKHRETCDILAEFHGSEIDFCDGCKDEYKCGIMLYCDDCHGIQCNNGYELKSLFEDDEEESEE